MLLPVAVTVAALAVLLLAEHRDLAALRAFAKLSASAGFLATAWAAGATETWFGHVILAALFACAIGDACLLFAGRPWFLAGLSAFAIGHLGYAFAFGGLGVAWVHTAAVGAVLTIPAWAVWRWLEPHVPADMRFPVLVYVAIITGMMALAWTCDGGAATWAIRSGATAFYLSDLSVARDVFVRRAVVNRLWGLPAYYIGQLLLAAAIAA